MLPTLDLAELYDFAIELAIQAGELIKQASLERHNGNQATATKKNRIDLVTKTDQAVEHFIKAAIATNYPSHAFLGEESEGAETLPFTDEPTWIVDPIDGTTNFVHGFPLVCVSIGFTIAKKPVVGVIYNPFLSQLYSARAGHGAFLNRSTPLPLSHPSPPAPLNSLSDALIAVEWGTNRKKHSIEKKANSFSKLAGDGDEIPGAVMAHSLRTLGSAALSFVMVAAGQVDMFWVVGCWSWDICAGVLIAAEAGGKLYGRQGKAWEDDDLVGRHYLVIRQVGDTETEQGGDAQDRIAQSFFNTVEEYGDP